MNDNHPQPHSKASLATTAVQWFGRGLDLLQELSVCGFSIFMVALGTIVFLYIEQGKEVLRALAERGDQTGATNLPRVLLFGLGLLLWSLTSWYSARILLYCEFFKDRQRPLPKNEWWDKFRAGVRSAFPRILGILPFAIVGTGFFLCALRYETTAPWGLKVLGALSYVGVVILYGAFRIRRNWLNRQYQGLTPEAKNKRDAELWTQSKTVIASMALVSVLFGLLLVIDPILFAGEMGTGAVLLVAGAAWVFWGSTLVYLGRRAHLPLLILLAGWVAICSLTNDNHDLRTITPTTSYRRPGRE